MIVVLVKCKEPAECSRRLFLHTVLSFLQTACLFLQNDVVGLGLPELSANVRAFTQGGVPMIRRIQTILAVLSFVLIYGRIEAQT